MEGETSYHASAESTTPPSFSGVREARGGSLVIQSRAQLNREQIAASDVLFVISRDGRHQLKRKCKPFSAETMTWIAMSLLVITFFCTVVSMLMYLLDGNDKSTGNCDSVTGTYVNSGGVTAFQSTDCDVTCGSAVPNAYRAIAVTEDVFINGKRPSRLGTYCVREGTSVTRCNTATSKLVRGPDNSWSCHPLWPSVFGGVDGGDILVCGGKLNDGERSYSYRLPPSSRMDPVLDPHNEVSRFKCTPGEYVEGPRDYMNNEYILMDENRFQRTRNNCAKYVANAVGIMKPLTGGFCNCLPTHGPLRRHGVGPVPVNGVSTDIVRYTEKERRPTVENANASETTSLRPELFQVPYACSPCVATGDLISTDGIFNFPVRCTKSNQKHFQRLAFMDKLPCGPNGFASASRPACTNAWIFVGERGMSYAVKKSTKEFGR
ncbi:hypothetical protein J6590_087497 [Homalodisca vitripennis]|nr:hypothetical protein J6590_087497 [Homalodisca vitripennis]